MSFTCYIQYVMCQSYSYLLGWVSHVIYSMSCVSLIAIFWDGFHMLCGQFMYQNVYFKQLRSVLCPSMSPFIYSSLILLSIDIMTIIHGNVGTVIIGVECATSYSQVILCSKAAILHCIFWIITKYKVNRGVQNNTCNSILKWFLRPNLTLWNHGFHNKHITHEIVATRVTLGSYSSHFIMFWCYIWNSVSCKLQTRK